MSRPDRPTPARLATPMAEGVLRQFMEKVAALEDRLSATEAAHADLVDRVALMESRDRTRGSGRRALSDDAVNALRFMEQHYPMKFTALIIAENANLDNKSLGSSLRVLASRGLISMISTEGRNALWQALAPEDRKDVSDDE